MKGEALAPGCWPAFSSSSRSFCQNLFSPPLLNASLHDNRLSRRLLSTGPAKQVALFLLLDRFLISSRRRQEPAKVFVREWEAGIHSDGVLELPVCTVVIPSEHVGHAQEVVYR